MIIFLSKSIFPLLAVLSRARGPTFTGLLPSLVCPGFRTDGTASRRHSQTAYVSHNGWTTASPVTLYFWTSVPPFASLAIFALALVMARRTGARREWVKCPSPL
jgi:hypothetical protein